MDITEILKDVGVKKENKGCRKTFSTDK